MNQWFFTHITDKLGDKPHPTAAVQAIHYNPMFKTYIIIELDPRGNMVNLMVGE